MSRRDREDKRLRDAFSSGSEAPGSAGGCPEDGEIWSASRGELQPERTKELLAHSVGCADCKQSWLAASVVADEAGLDRAETVDSAVTGSTPAVRQGGTGMGSVVRFRVRHHTLVTAAAAIAATLLVMLVLTNVLNRNEIPDGVTTLAANVQTSLWRVGEQEPLASGDALSIGDQIYMIVESDEPLNVYIINTDETGVPSVLFPIEGSQWSNPLPAGKVHRLPGDIDWQYDSWEVSSSGGQESFTLIASLEPLSELEAALSGMAAAVPEDQFTRGKNATPRTPAMIPAEAMAALTRVLSNLRGTSESVVVREIVLENPGSPDE